MSRNAYLGLTSPSGTRPLAVPDDIRGYRREDPAGRCPACRHHARIEGPAWASRHTGQAAIADVCLPTITNFHKIGCEPAQPAAGHICDFSVSLNGRESKNKGRFFKAPDGTLTMAER